jgi:hypothetical protein
MNWWKRSGMGYIASLAMLVVIAVVGSFFLAPVNVKMQEFGDSGELYLYPREMTTAQVRADLKVRGRQAAGLNDLRSFHKQYPEQFQAIVALGAGDGVAILDGAPGYYTGFMGGYREKWQSLEAASVEPGHTWLSYNRFLARKATSPRWLSPAFWIYGHWPGILGKT